MIFQHEINRYCAPGPRSCSLLNSQQDFIWSDFGPLFMCLSGEFSLKVVKTQIATLGVTSGFCTMLIEAKSLSGPKDRGKKRDVESKTSPQ